MSEQHLTIGWREWVSFPQLGIPAIKTKVDTGARTSCLHTSQFEIVQKDGIDWVNFIIHPLTSEDTPEIHCSAPVLDYREVSDSGGHRQNRPFIRAKMQIGQHLHEVDLSLTNREGMKFRMLLGRTALSGAFLVDVSQNYLIGTKPSLS
ncbi:MAG: RimK/LysX family protein [Akkermansiaceae bacterium]|nr:RimK/LysX family protein [Akkermansiaceae bacterium]